MKRYFLYLFFFECAYYRFTHRIICETIAEQVLSIKVSVVIYEEDFSKSRTSGFICLATNREHSRNEEIKLQKWYVPQRVIEFQDVVRYPTQHGSK